MEQQRNWPVIGRLTADMNSSDEPPPREPEMTVRTARIVAAALVGEPLSLIASALFLVSEASMLQGVATRVLMTGLLIVIGLSILQVHSASTQAYEWNRRYEKATINPQTAQFSMRFGTLGTRVFDRAGLPPPLRNTQRVLSVLAPVILFVALVS